jgi:hypothetical protein
MLFNNARCKELSLDCVNRMPAKWLHRFCWTRTEKIGKLPLDWNFLVGEYEKTDKLPRGIHYTNGGPWFHNYKNVDYSEVYEYYKQIEYKKGR